MSEHRQFLQPSNKADISFNSWLAIADKLLEKVEISAHKITGHQPEMRSVLLSTSVWNQGYVE